VFLDSNGWVAVVNASDALHRVADGLWRQLGKEQRPVVLTDWVIAETGNGLARCAARRLFMETVELFESSPNARLVFVDSALLHRALALYSERPDKTWGLVDCASFIVMRDLRIRDAFTNDRHFIQAGFRCLLPPPSPAS
jgi:hypothetical protein